MRRFLLAGTVLSLAALPGAARAVDFTIGAGIGVAPDYEGSDDYEAVPLWNLRADDLSDPNTYVQIFTTKLNSNFIPHENWRLGLSAEYIPKRSDVDDDKVDDMRNTDDGFLVGALIGYDFNFENDRVLGLELDPRWDISDEIGGLVTARVNYNSPLGEKWAFRVGAEGTWASTRYMSEFFTVNSQDAARSGLKEDDADSGIKDIGVSGDISYAFTESWSVTGLAAYNRLLGDAEDSPVTDDRGDENQLFAGVLVNFRF